MGTKKQRGYPIKGKLAALGHPHGTVPGWWVGRAKLRIYEGNKLDKTTKGQGRMIAFIQENYPDWIEAYAENKKSDRLKTDFAIEFWSKYGSYSLPEIYNMDETAIQFDMPPARTWATKGRKGSAKIQNLTKHCGRMTAVLTVRADGKNFRFSSYCAANVADLLIPTS
ncbi:uncharacterized protein PITG_08290 [Phytophthora infestans T30-4]|uniref:Uncharacterized protein n=1 Tax=Phytophthora infestans (strain T30-4) TaxID=403677 RepID=D0NA87_PHYIT|nr:uncharacterized protein PITG_08290 [Phytophthora infestans T30-4]EEY54745.1 conserved hypothetical protein [Phytophthora infestans T30-4]|eukprot:XP_002903690.1 conserved hypothetical protein [Phytophthora infestans T30-4]